MGVKLGAVCSVSQGRNFASLSAVFGINSVSVSAPSDFIRPPNIDFSPDYANSNMFAPKTINLSKSESVIFKIR